MVYAHEAEMKPLHDSLSEFIRRNTTPAAH
jgi:hypothetical protein